MIVNLKYYRDHSFVRTIFIIFKKIFIYWNKVSYLNTINKDLEIKTSYYPVLKLDKDNELLCTSCHKCEDVCPTKCISLTDYSGGSDMGFENLNFETKLKPKTFSIDLSACTQCKECEEICEDEAIKITGFYSDKQISKGPLQIAALTDQKKDLPE